ncbi:MAG TPA: hypothetical protein PLP29_19995 [Candidatus Ozemobacteraceae bacterium]|nr:hypothetical protein [Candidatus Ozemobacteraceae bacterium]
MPEASNRERDLVLAPNEYALISDQTKGHIVVYVGPCKTSLANTDQPVIFNDRSKRFERCNLEQSISIFSTAPEGWYLNLKNPAKDSHQPRTFGPNNLPELNIGRKVNIPGPVSFSLWPGQMVRVIQGHHLRSNQYLVVRVYDEEAAKANWKKAVIKPQTAVSPDGSVPLISAPPAPQDPKSGVVDPSSDVPELTMGKLLVIKGTDVSFYIPPTGIEVVRDAKDAYVREAVTLERLEYCILLDEDGNKRYIQGPAVVFPHPTETFVEKHSSRKFKAIELNEISGLYIKVIAPYKDANGVEYKVGEELFITGKDQMIYFPRPEHAIIKYGDQEINYAVAIPAGEGRYFLNRNTGKVTLKRGPCMFLPDPRQEVIVRRIIEPRQCTLWFPGNQEALEYNQRLKNIARLRHAENYLADDIARSAKLPVLPAAPTARPGQPPAPAPEHAGEEFAGDDFTRKRGFTQPRTITLDTKYEGAVAIDVWTGYAVLVVGRAGERKVIAGPQTYLLEYDESLESLELSTGTPKSDDNKIKTAYLRVLHNKVSDIVEAETSDLCRVRLKLSYRVNFEGDPNKWFNVENYVKFLTDHMRSLVRHAVKQHRIEEFYANAIKFIRDTILGTAGNDNKRAGRSFTENGMHIYDVEVLDVKIGDEAIEKLLIDAQHSVVKQTLEIASQKRQLDFTQQNEGIRQQIAEAQSKTKQQEFDLLTREARAQLTLNLAKIESESEARRKNLDAKLADQDALGKIDAAELARRKEAFDLEVDVAKRKLSLRIDELKSETEAVIGKAGAVTPELIAALQAFGDKALAERMAQSMAPLAILGGKSISDVFAQLLKGTALEGVLKSKHDAR